MGSLTAPRSGRSPNRLVGIGTGQAISLGQNRPNLAGSPDDAKLPLALTQVRLKLDHLGAG
jgi:hypothetical protein